MKFGIVIILLSCAATAPSQELDMEFPLSVEEARNLGKSDDSVFDSEFGVAEGPFRWIASNELSSNGRPSFRVRYGKGPLLHRSETKDRLVRFHVLYFVNPKGNGFGVIHRKAAFGETLPELKKEDKRSYEQVRLSEAAKFALENNKPALLDSLFKAGLKINQPVEEAGRTLLFYAALHGDESLIKKLLKLGADPLIRNEYGDRPIDAARKAPIRELLRLPERKEPQIVGFPEGMIREAFFREPSEKEDVRFLSFNGKDPDEALMALARKSSPQSKFYPKSIMEQVSKNVADQDKSYSHYRKRASKEYGVLHELTLTTQTAGATIWRHRVATGPFLAGGGSKGTIEKKYGYWISTGTSSWDE